MCASYNARHYRSEVRVTRRVFQGVGSPDHEDVMVLGFKEAREFAALLIEAADKAEGYDRTMANRALADARERLGIAQAEYDRLAKLAGNV